MSFVKARRAAALFATVAIAACGDSTAPTIDHIDATAAMTAAAPVAAVMDQPALASFTAIDGTVGLPASASAAAVSAVSRLTAAAAQGRWDGRVPTFARSAARAADVLPPDVRGKTYVYSEATSQYQAAEVAETGTPANGMRVILYAWDVLNDMPSAPLTRVGHVDFDDRSNGGQNALNVVLVRASDNATLMNYDIAHSVTASNETFSITGSATNGTSPITFNLSGTATATAATITFHLAATSVGYSVDVGASMNGEQATVETSLRYNGHRLSFRLTAHANGIDGEVKFDGRLYATLTITIEETPTSVTTTMTFQKANGRPLTVEELEQIQGVFERALNFDRFWGSLLWPLGVLAGPPV
jgi:hypothetical protein